MKIPEAIWLAYVLIWERKCRSTGERTSMVMHWDDRLVPGAHDLNRDTAPTSPFFGLNTSDAETAREYTTSGDGNSRAWGSHGENAQIVVRVVGNDAVADELCAKLAPADRDDDGIPDDPSEMFGDSYSS